jgi:hypothetical protein
MDERYGESCTDLVNNSQCRKVYCGYIDPTQGNDQVEFSLEETQNGKLKDICRQFAATFLNKK